MLSVEKPIYIKNITPNGAIIPSYRFNIIINEDNCIQTIIEDETVTINDVFLKQTIQNNVNWWKDFLSAFINLTKKFFSKSYTVEDINKRIKNNIDTHEINASPCNVILIPDHMLICQSDIQLFWKSKCEQIVIDLPDYDEQITNSTMQNEHKDSDLTPPAVKDLNDLISADLNELSIEEVHETSKTQPIQQTDINRKYYKQKVKEAMLKAKLAAFKADRKISEYYEKYGTTEDISDTDSEYVSDESDSEYESDGK